MTDSPPASVRRDASLLTTLRQLFPYFWPSDRPDLQRVIAGSLALILVAKGFTILMPFTFKWATDALVVASGGRADPASAMPWLIGAPLLAVALYSLVRILMTVFTQLREGLFARVAMHAVRQLALHTFKHMHRLSLRFHLERKTGGLTRVLERGRNGIEEITRMTLMTLIPTIVEFVLVIAVFAIEFDWRYVVIVVVMIVLYLWFTIVATVWRMRIRKEMNESDTDANAKAVDSLLNFETVKYFGAEARETARYDRSLAIYERASIKTYTSLAVLNTGQAVIFTLALGLCMALSATDVVAGRNSVGHFVMINALMIQLYQPLNFMGMVYREIKQAIVDIEQMFDILKREAEVRDDPAARPLAVRDGHIRFENVSFHYTPERPILRGVSFEVPPGRTVAIVGPSGAGKSTISRLLFRFYDVSGGAITIDGQDIRAVTQASLRAAIGIVPQDTVLFNDTIRYNIGYGRAGADQEAVAEAAAMAQIDPFIRSLPEGYESQVGERGLKLSGGEKQRVAIARTILKGPPILVLDEATSALDSYTEKEIQDALERVSRGRSTLVIAHRLSTVVNADRILCLDRGVIVESGTHEELLALGGVYAGMWNKQREADVARETLQRAEAGEAPSLRQNLGA
ncbi:MAG: ABC transporter ATP-binding protein/permease [Hyphomicrobiales bacterium]|uniref:ABCB family ABC transporter ATP-binding protein/permease n=1 Tax=Rhabdaerophilum calidifontis TaxID=2604328 RepID=UPI001239B6A8|nr:ABC transporter ATP-binding protein/permease [Rhabdaerophilum calidifontis]MCA1952241.1 ABC transporter ATP-binding protein/permease [Hyphomicrobiales bacterium]MCA1999343.1 ABC transporter ATP-binding protein/permease [Hyphomicrobiales bacterium]